MEALHIKDAGHAWRLVMTGTAGVFLMRLGIYLTELADKPPGNWVVLSASVFMVAITGLAFAIGDWGPLSIIRAILRNPRDTDSYQKMDRSVWMHVLLMGVHATIIPLMAWFAPSNPDVCLWMMMLLAPANMIWLGLTLLQFRSCRMEYVPMSKMWKKIDDCEVAMIKWTVLNGCFFLFQMIVFVIMGTHTHSIEIGIWLGILRTVLDFYYCRMYYTDIIRGRYSFSTLVNDSITSRQKAM